MPHTQRFRAVKRCCPPYRCFVGGQSGTQTRFLSTNPEQDIWGGWGEVSSARAPRQLTHRGVRLVTPGRVIRRVNPLARDSAPKQKLQRASEGPESEGQATRSAGSNIRGQIPKTWARSRPPAQARRWYPEDTRRPLGRTPETGGARGCIQPRTTGGRPRQPGRPPGLPDSAFRDSLTGGGKGTGYLDVRSPRARHLPPAGS